MVSHHCQRKEGSLGHSPETKSVITNMEVKRAQKDAAELKAREEERQRREEEDQRLKDRDEAAKLKLNWTAYWMQSGMVAILRYNHS